jgi:predicted nucleic acid-binding protein
MILVDTSVWIDHLRSTSTSLSDLLERRQVLGHAMVLGEVMLGSIKDRNGFKSEYLDLPPADLADHGEVLMMIDFHRWHGRGIGFIDAHILASAYLGDAQLLTTDKKLLAVASELGIAL